MTTLTATMEDALLIRARELRTMIEDPACDNGTRQDLTPGYFQLLRRLHERGINFYATRSKPRRFVAGKRVGHREATGRRPGRVVTHRDGLVEVDSGCHGTTLVAADELELDAA